MLIFQALLSSTDVLPVLILVQIFCKSFQQTTNLKLLLARKVFLFHVYLLLSYFQCQCLINVCGDAVCTSKDGEVMAIVIPESARKHSDSPSLSTSSVFREITQPVVVSQT